MSKKEEQKEKVGSADASAPVLGLVAQFLKDISFENFVTLNEVPEAGAEPKLDVEVQVNSSPAKEKGMHEVELSIVANAKAGKMPIFLVEMTYTGVFYMENIPDDMLRPTLFIECPRLLYPFARSIVANIVADGNMPMPLLPIIDFADLYIKNQQEVNKPAS